MKNNKAYVMEFETNGPCYVRVYEYNAKKKLFHGHKGNLIYVGCVTGVMLDNNHRIEDVCGLTDYGFRKYLSNIIDAVFEDAKEHNVLV